MPDSVETSPAYAAAVADLLGMLAYAELAACARLAADSDLAPTVSARVALARMAGAELAHHDLLAARIVELGADPEEVMAPYAEAFAAFHDRTRPSTWLEAVVKAYVGDGIAEDFGREIAAFADPRSREVIEGSLSDEARNAVLVDLARAGMTADPQAIGRLALWGRRLHGEAISSAQAAAAERDGLTALLTGQFGGAGLDLARLGELFARLATRHTDRMAALGLDA